MKLRATCCLIFFWIVPAIASAAPPARDRDQIYFPTGYDVSKKYPLVIMLHAFKVSGGFQRFYFGLNRLKNKKSFILFVPGSSYDRKGHRFWNAMDYCCNHEQLQVDDVGYLKATIENAIAKHGVDPSRVYLLGHSNGAMMAHRLACVHADLFAGVVSLAGSGMRDLVQCKPSSPVAFLEVHAKNDRIVPYEGMTEEALRTRLQRKPLYPYSRDASLVRYPSAVATVQDWATKNGCDTKSASVEGPVHYAMNVFFKETTKTIWQTGCKNGSSVELWTLERGTHVPRFNSRFKNDILDFLLRHRKQKFAAAANSL